MYFAYIPDHPHQCMWCFHVFEDEQALSTHHEGSALAFPVNSH